MAARKLTIKHCSLFLHGSFFNGDAVENMKRRRSMSNFALDLGSKQFFEKILSVKKTKETIFFTKSKSKNR